MARKAGERVRGGGGKGVVNKKEPRDNGRREIGFLIEFRDGEGSLIRRRYLYLDQHY